MLTLQSVANALSAEAERLTDQIALRPSATEVERRAKALLDLRWSNMADGPAYALAACLALDVLAQAQN